MFKIDSLNASPSNEWVDESVVGGVSGTRMSADWFNAVQRELIAILTAAGIAPNKSVDNQVLTAIQELIDDAVAGGGSGGSAYWIDAVANPGALPAGKPTGSIGLSISDLALYRYNGSAWVVFFESSDFAPVATTVTLAGTQTLENKTLLDPTISSPQGLVKADVGLSQVDNTTDAGKPVSTAMQAALDLKLDDSDRGATNGVASLVSGKVPTSELPTTPWFTSGGLYSVAVVTANPAPAVIGTHYLANTTSAGFTITLPAGSSGAKIKIQDSRGTWDVNNLTIAPATGERIWPLAVNATLACNVLRGWIELAWDGSGWSPNSLASTTLGSSGGGLVGQAATGTTTAVNGVMYQCNTTGGAFTVTLPGGTTAAVVGVLDAGPYFATNNLTVAPASGQSIDVGAADDVLALNANRANCIFYRASGATVWEIQSSSLTLYSEASETVPGIISTGAQTFGGAKTFAAATTLGTTSSVGQHNFYGATADLYTATGFNTQIAEVRNFKAGAAGNTAQFMFRVTTGDSTASLWSVGNVANAGSNSSDFVFKSQNGAAATMETFRIGVAGAVNFSKIHNIGSGNVTSGRYTPIPTYGSGVTSATMYSCQYIRVGNIVSVTGRIDVTTNVGSNTSCLISINLPVASNLAASTDLSGTGSRAVAAGSSYTAVYIYGDAPNDRAAFEFPSAAAGTQAHTFNFQYEVI